MAAFDATHTNSAVARLRKTDPALRGVIDRVGECTLRPQPGGFQMLVNSILSQQISTAAARTIRGRLMSQMPGRSIKPEWIAELSDEQLQAVGISAQKRGYLRHLTACTIDGTINFRRIARTDDEGVIEELIQVKGIGRWTAQMFLIFCLGRMDVFAPDDLGLRNAAKLLYGLPDSVTRTELEAHAERWAPHRTIASWYLWRMLDFQKNSERTGK